MYIYIYKYISSTETFWHFEEELFITNDCQKSLYLNE